MYWPSRIFSNFIVDPVKLTLTDKLVSVIVCFSAILISAWITDLFNKGDQAILVASMGASAVILFIIPNSPLAQPWPFAGGQLVSAAVGVTCAQFITDTATAASCAVGLAVFLMLILRCLHPPGAATALAPVLGGNVAGVPLSFVIMPVAINVVIMSLLAVSVNRWMLKRDYPVQSTADKSAAQKREYHNTELRLTLTESDINQALKQMDTFVDTTTTELIKLLEVIENQVYVRLKGHVTCADIMTRKVTTTEFATEVEDAWKTMQTESIRAMPVIDTSGRVIGMLTRHDFFKHINLSAYEGVQEKIRRFIQRTPFMHSDKPECVGHIMNDKVAVLSEDAHIAKLIPLMSQLKHKQIPIVDARNRFSGMVYQADVIAALYYKQLRGAMAKKLENSDATIS